MAQRTGIHSILNNPFIYNFIQYVFTHKKTMDFWDKLIGDVNNKTILDVGCGPGKDALLFLGSNYIGVDLSKEYIDEAKSKYSEYGTFYQLSIDDIETLEISNIDIIILKGVVHHLNDSQVLNFLKKIKDKMSEDGRIFTIDPVFTTKQNIISKQFISFDRGKDVRYNNEYDSLVEKSDFKINSSFLIKQTFPPYQRYLMEIVKK